MFEALNNIFGAEFIIESTFGRVLQWGIFGIVTGMLLCFILSLFGYAIYSILKWFNSGF